MQFCRGLKIYINKGFFLSLISILGIVFFILLQNISFDNRKWLADDHPVEINKDFVKDNFSPYEELIIIFSLKGKVFDENNLLYLKQLSDELRSHDLIHKVQTPVTSQIIVGNESSITLTSLFSAYQKGLIKDRSSLEDRFSDSIYNKILANQNFDQALVVISHKLPGRFTEYDERSEIIGDVTDIVNKYSFYHDYKFAGESFLGHQIDNLNMNNLSFLLFLSLIVTFVLLIVIYQNFLKIMLVSASSICCLIYTLLLFHLFDKEISIVSMVLPILVVVISLSDSIFIQARAELLFKSFSDRKNLIRELIKKTWMPCFLTSLTTAIGFGSFYFSKIVPLKILSYLSVVSIFGSYIIIVSLNWVSIYLLFDELKSIGINYGKKRYLGSILNFSNNLVEVQHKKIIFFSLVIVLLFSAGLFRIYTETNFIKIFFKEKHPVSINHQIIDDEFHGSNNIDLVILNNDTPLSKIHQLQRKEISFQDIEDFNYLNDIKYRLTSVPYVNKLLSYHDIISMVHRGFLPDAIYPYDSFQLEQELLFLEFSKNDSDDDVLEPYLNFPKTASLIEIKTDNLSSLEIDKLISEVEKITKDMKLEDGNYFLSGNNVYFHSLSKYIISTQLISVLIAFVFITLLMFVIFNIKVALFSIVPNFFPPLITLGAVSWLNIPFDFSTILIASISFGITIDSSIHLLHVYQSLNGSGRNDKEIRDELLNIVGSPIIISCTIFLLVFLLFVFSDIVMLIKFGVFSMVAIFSSFLINILVIPAMLKYINLTTVSINR